MKFIVEVKDEELESLMKQQNTGHKFPKDAQYFVEEILEDAGLDSSVVTEKL